MRGAGTRIANAPVEALRQGNDLGLVADRVVDGLPCGLDVGGLVIAHKDLQEREAALGRGLGCGRGCGRRGCG